MSSRWFRTLEVVEARVADFAAALLHQDVDPDRIQPQPYKLNNLLYGVAIVDAILKLCSPVGFG